MSSTRTLAKVTPPFLPTRASSLLLSSNPICHLWACLLCFSHPFLLSSLPAFLWRAAGGQGHCPSCPSAETGVSQLRTTDILRGTILCFGACPMYSGCTRLPPTRCPKTKPRSSIVTTQKVFRHCHMSPAGRNHQDEHHWCRLGAQCWHRVDAE